MSLAYTGMSGREVDLQQDNATAYTSQHSMEILDQVFGEMVISQ
jgi:hypothetical protein